MEAFYHNDPRIEEWVQQVIEKVFSTCLLTGEDAEAEYHNGCKNVANLTSLLKEFSMLPSEYLADGLHQILEQQLPDSRVINNFPEFRETMNRMLIDGMSKAIDTQWEDVIPIPALAPIHNHISEETIIDDSSEHKAVITQDQLNDPIDSGVKRLSDVSENTDRLSLALNYVFPNTPVDWNVNVLGCDFLARVDDILICRYDSANPCQTETFKKNGWKVLLCQEEDLFYPRRLERQLKNIRRLGRPS
ncbi:hypothetical protein [Desulfosporosinus youngiae]|uniref:Uncharacterized protein n=1 Tax=Desulfosporosinus youngiae DSM 17734 TaxID=768710 RepID=H5Y4Y4_9FIRM|nr:hypothetical protein [Desulfosporosinus youngiae]EHQ90019.1 hypothetical protein DesyoDRAFT_2973 [Desulfosporosinus youngiae DSM 17734]